ncbi:late histone H2B.L4-like [Delphinapterus leucas]|uniref:Late histone H2B.L4-like n=1 Tax=Delphinapterus leucas TaxID=9749 RepID=A0A2Y9MNB9_DELLE|nr:late histone H2B.L4-like [Delphinapterus leucas]
MHEPSSEMSEESLATKEAESSEAEPKNPKQKTLKRHRRRHSDGFDSFATYFPRVLKRVHEGLSLSQEAVNVMDSFVKDIFERIANEAARLVRSSKRSTLSSREIQTSVRLLLPGEVGKHAVSNASKAVIRYTTGK